MKNAIFLEKTLIKSVSYESNDEFEDDECTYIPWSDLNKQDNYPEVMNKSIDVASA